MTRMDNSCDTSMMRASAWSSPVGPARNAQGAPFKAPRGTRRRSCRWMLLVSALALLVLSSTNPTITSSAGVNRDGSRWIGTWATAPQPYPPGSLQSFRNQTLRLIVHTSAGGTKVRIKISNTYGDQPLLIGTVHIARRTAAADIDPTSDRTLMFHGQQHVGVCALSP